MDKTRLRQLFSVLAMAINEASTNNPHHARVTTLAKQFGASIKPANAELDQVLDMRLSDICSVLEVKP